MIELIIIIFVIYTLYKKYNTSSYFNLVSLLQKQGFRNLLIIQQNQTNYWLRADFHGDNYLFNVIKGNSAISDTILHPFIEYATKNHFHNLILVPGNSIISSISQKTISEYQIEIWNQEKINELSHQENPSAIVKTSPVHDSCKIEPSEDPIQDGTKANSVWGNLFGNKIERL